MTTSVPAQQDGGATILEIGQQPDVWREVSKRYDPAVAEFLDADRRPPRHPHRPDRSGQLGVHRRHRCARPSAPPRPPRRSRPDDRHRRQPARLPRAAHPDPDGVLRPVGQQPRKPRHHRAGRRTRRRHLAPRPHLRPQRRTEPRAQRPAELPHRLHAGSRQRHRLRHDVEPHLDAADVSAAAWACDRGRR